MNIMGTELPSGSLSDSEFKFLQLHSESLDLEKLWQLMDAEWERCHSKPATREADAVGEFYESPVWLLNGLFTEVDPESVRHRESIARWVGSQNPRLVADFGGGFGSLARKIAARTPRAVVQVIEPHPTGAAKALADDFVNLSYVPDLPRDADVVIAQDVLEHVVDPLRVFCDLLDATRDGGAVITANCFHPVIACHLPETFHFRYSFKFIAPLLGCRFRGHVPGVRHAQIFTKVGRGMDLSRVRKLESASRMAFPVLETISASMKRARRFGRTT